jgi:hypothetical protein
MSDAASSTHSLTFHKNDLLPTAILLPWWQANLGSLFEIVRGRKRLVN